MILLAELIDRYRSDLEQRHGRQLLPGHHRALQAMRRCRNQHSRVMVLECTGCHNQVSLPHSCGHRSCPHCQHHESQQWLERQKAKLLAVDYFMATFTVPAQLRGMFWANQRIAYDLLLKTAGRRSTVLPAVILNCEAAPAPMLCCIPMSATLIIIRMCI